MPPFRIVKVIDAVCDLSAGQFRVIKGQVTFESTEERLSDSVVPAVFLSAHTTNDTTGIQRSLVFIASVGAPAVRVVMDFLD